MYTLEEIFIPVVLSTPICGRMINKGKDEHQTTDGAKVDFHPLPISIGVGPWRRRLS